MSKITASAITQLYFLTGEYFKYSPKIISYANGETVVSAINPYSKYNDYVDDRFLTWIKRADIYTEIDNLNENEIILFQPSLFAYQPYDIATENDNFIRYCNHTYLVKNFKEDYPELFWATVGNGFHTVYIDCANAPQEIINVFNDTEINTNRIANFNHYISERTAAIEKVWDEDYVYYFRNLLESKYNLKLSSIPNGFLTEVFWDYQTTVQWKNPNGGMKFVIDLQEIVNRMGSDGHFNKAEIERLLQWSSEDKNYEFMMNQYK